MKRLSKRYPSIMIAAASDPSAAAGVQADLKTCCALHIYATTALTAVTAQNSLEVVALEPVSSAMLLQQMECAWTQIRPEAMKIGMLPTAEAVETVAGFIRSKNIKNVIVDPVMTASSGKELADSGASWLDAMLGSLLPLATLVTPNLPELQRLAGESCCCQRTAIEELGRRLLRKSGCQAALLKGGHGSDPCYSTDIFLETDSARAVTVTTKRYDTPNLRGTGCTLSSAIACFLARGFSLREAFYRGHGFLQRAIREGCGYAFDVERGAVNHFEANSIPE